MINQNHHSRNQQMGNVQKEIISNYFLHKYSTLMSEMTHHHPHQYQSNFHTNPKSPSNKVNFKTLLQLRQRKNHHIPPPPASPLKTDTPM